MRSHRSQRFEPTVQWLLALYGFFIAFPVVNVPVIGVSITFPIFLAICCLVWARGGCIFRVKGRLDSLLLWFFLACAFSILLAPDVDIDESAIFLRDCMSFMYLAYWFSVYLFFRKWFWSIDLKLLSYGFLAGMCLACLLIFFGAMNGGYYVAGPFKISQNSYAVNLVACIGISMWEIYRRLRVKGVLILAALFFYAALVSQSRTGAILVFLQCGMLTASMLLVGHVQLRRFIVGLLIASAFVGSYSTSGSTIFGGKLGSALKPYNPELAKLLADPEGVLKMDKSWMIRQVQVEKGVRLFQENPLTGVGYRHFRSVLGDVDMSGYSRLKSDVSRYGLDRSSHNSHIQVLAETGLMGFFPFLLVNVFVVFEVVRQLFRKKPAKFTIFLGVSLLGLTAYFWVVSAVTGAMWYVALGLFVGSISGKGQKDRLALRDRKRPVLIGVDTSCENSLGENAELKTS